MSCARADCWRFLMILRLCTWEDDALAARQQGPGQHHLAEGEPARFSVKSPFCPLPRPLRGSPCSPHSSAHRADRRSRRLHVRARRQPAPCGSTTRLQQRALTVTAPEPDKHHALLCPGLG